jgi:hypothetical protein|tara:strand:+ start:3004 stop:3735 length:732 start_codon:yes stop_codon:yes gene_type:complete
MVRGPTLRRWHRRLGIVVSIFLLVLAVTGILLNHEPALNLNKVEVRSGWLMSLYGMEGVASEVDGFDLEGSWLVSHNGSLYLGSKAIGSAADKLVGAVRATEMIVVSDERQIFLYTFAGDLIERYTPTDLTPPFVGLGMIAGAPVLRTDEGLFMADADMVDWGRFPADVKTYVTWSKAQRLPEAQRNLLDHELRGGGLPLYRILLDVHSGRIFSDFGRYVMDAAAVLLIVLSITGLWIWWPKR